MWFVLEHIKRAKSGSVHAPFHMVTIDTLFRTKDPNVLMYAARRDKSKEKIDLMACSAIKITVLDALSTNSSSSTSSRTARCSVPLPNLVRKRKTKIKKESNTLERSALPHR